VTLERGLLRIVLSLSLVAAVMGGWLAYRDTQMFQALTVCDKIEAARREFPGKSDVDALALYYNVHSDILDARGVPLPDRKAVARMSIARAAAENDAQSISECYSSFQRILHISLWALAALAAVWAVFFFLRWIVMGFRGATR
jgi:hypothetical protein